MKGQHMIKPRTADLRLLLETGYRLLPLHAPFATRRDKKGNLRKAGKSPLDFAWTKKIYDSRKVVSRYGGINNIGIQLRDTDLILDVDVRHGGKEGLLKLRAACPDWKFEDSVRAVTGGGGLHIYLTKPADFKPVTTLPEFPGIEFKTKGTQIVAPGSVHPDTKKFYSWHTLSASLAEVQAAPKSLLKLIKRPPPPENTPDAGEISPEQLAKMLDYLKPEDFNTNDLWLPIMFACHQATGGEGRQEFIDWSTSDPAFTDRDIEIGARWDSCDPNEPGGITARTLYKELIAAECPMNLIPGNSPEDEFDDIDELDAPDDGEETESESDDECSEDAFEPLGQVDPESIPPRPWHVKGVLYEEKCYGLVGPGGAGKSVCSLILAVVMATGKPFGPWESIDGKPRKVLIVQGEDSRDELEMRLIAICKTMRIDRAQIKGRILIDKKQKDIRLVETNQKTGKRRTTNFWKRIRRAIQKLGIDCVMIDPFVKTHSGFNESDNADMQFVIEKIEELLAGLQCSLLMVHHTSKSGGADDANSIRGASAIANAFRGGHTFYPMTGAEHEKIKPPLPKERYVRITGVKQNYAEKFGARWFRLEIQNVNSMETAVGLQPVNFEISDATEDFNVEEDWPRYEDFLDRIQEGRPDGNRYTASNRGPEKARADALLKNEFGMTMKQARARLDSLIDTGILREGAYKPKTKNKNERHARQGLFVVEQSHSDDDL